MRGCRLKRRGSVSVRFTRLRISVTLVSAFLLFLVLGASASAKTQTRTVGPQQSASIPLAHGIQLIVPRHTLETRGRISVESLPGHLYSITISARWRRRIRIVARIHGSIRTEPLGGIMFVSPPSAAKERPQAHAALSLNPLNNVCVKVAVAVGTAAIETGPFDPEIDGTTVAACLLKEGATFIGRALAAKIASALGHDCAAALLKSGTNDVKAAFFDVPQCNEPRGPSGPSNGAPLIVATLQVPTPPGIPIGVATPTNPTGTPSPSPGPAPTPAPLPAAEFHVMNASGGIYWRSAPDWNSAEATPGNGFYPDTVIKVSCYQSGSANVPGSSDAMWEQASWVAGSGGGSGWINEHFINDGSAINQPSPGIPPCAAPPPPAPQTWAETAGGVAHTWTNYTNAGGTQGPSIAGGQTVAIACKLQGFRVADGNTWWYRIASSPWSDNFYVSADAFYNNGATSGPLKGTPFVDPAVANC